MESYCINNNKERRSFWNKLVAAVPETTLQSVLATFPLPIAQIIKLHYQEGYALKEIASSKKKSISVIRNCRNRGIFLLYQAFSENITVIQKP